MIGQPLKNYSIVMLLFLFYCSDLSGQTNDSLGRIEQVNHGLNKLNFQVSENVTLSIGCKDITVGELLHLLDKYGITVFQVDVFTSHAAMQFGHWELLLNNNHRIEVLIGGEILSKIMVMLSNTEVNIHAYSDEK